MSPLHNEGNFGSRSPSNDTRTLESRIIWESNALAWAQWERTFSAGLSDTTNRLIAQAGILPGMRVLDVACGIGSQSLQVAERVGPTGSVVANDISPTMLILLDADAKRSGLDNVETLDCAAEYLDETAGPFDSAICRLGLMMLPQPRKAMKAIHEVLKPGARFAALVFSSPENNPCMAEPMAILRQHAGRFPLTPGQPGIFTLGDEVVLKGSMQKCGFVNVQMQTVRAPLLLQKASDATAMMHQAFPEYRDITANLNPANRSEAWGEVHEYLKNFERDGHFKADLEFLIVSGTKPAGYY